jgi:hypothetical protein
MVSHGKNDSGIAAASAAHDPRREETHKNSDNKSDRYNSRTGSIHASVPIIYLRPHVRI